MVLGSLVEGAVSVVSSWMAYLVYPLTLYTIWKGVQFFWFVLIRDQGSPKEFVQAYASPLIFGWAAYFLFPLGHFEYLEKLYEPRTLPRAYIAVLPAFCWIMAILNTIPWVNDRVLWWFLPLWLKRTKVVFFWTDNWRLLTYFFYFLFFWTADWMMGLPSDSVHAYPKHNTWFVLKWITVFMVPLTAVCCLWDEVRDSFRKVRASFRRNRGSGIATAPGQEAGEAQPAGAGRLVDLPITHYVKEFFQDIFSGLFKRMFLGRK